MLHFIMLTSSTYSIMMSYRGVFFAEFLFILEIHMNLVFIKKECQDHNSSFALNDDVSLERRELRYPSSIQRCVNCTHNYTTTINVNTI